MFNPIGVEWQQSGAIATTNAYVEFQMEVEVNKQMWKKRLLIISILGNILSLFLIGIYFLVNSWFFHAELGSIVGIKPDYLIQLNNEGVLYDYRQMISIASGIRSYKLINSLESDNYYIYKSIYNHQIFIGQVDQIHQKYIIYDGYLDHYIFVNLKFNMDKKQYADFIGRIKVIDGYENVPIRYRKLIENGNWEYL